MKINKIGAGKKLNEKDIEDFEIRKGFKLPLDYKIFLLKHNGGMPEHDTYTSRVGQGYNLVYKSRRIEYFGVNLFFEMEKIGSGIFDNEIPQNLISIGEDGAGNCICISISGDDHGKIYFWDHEGLSDDDNEATFSNIYFITDNFNDLIYNLKEFPDNSKPVLKDFIKYCKKGKIKKIRTLLDEGLDINSTDDSGWSLLMIAISNFNEEILDELINRGASISNMLHFAVSEQAIRYLVKKGADINEKKETYFGQTPLFTSTGNPRKVKLLLELGADINITDTYEKRAIDYTINRVAENFKESYRILKEAEEKQTKK